MINTIRVVIEGRVQGVGFRAWAVVTASRMGLRGWVRNRNDDSVEAVFCGEDEIVLAMVEACKEGPVTARVDSIECFTWKEEVTGQFAARPTV